MRRNNPDHGFVFFAVLALLFLLPSSSQAAAPAAGLVGYWSFDEGSGTIASDSSGLGNSGTVSGAAWVAGKISGALDFDGAYHRYVNIANQASFDFDRTDPFSACAWIRPGVNSVAAQDILSKLVITPSYRGWEFFVFAPVGTDMRLHVQLINGAGSLRIYSNGILAVNAWQHACFTYDGSGNPNGLKIYQGGVLQGKTVQLGSLSAGILNDEAVQIGSDVNYPFNGAIDEVRIYDRALSAQEISDVYNDAGIPPSGPPVISAFSASPASIVSGQSSVLSWSVSGATSLSIDQGIGPVTGLASRSVSPAATATYTLTAANALGSTTSMTTVAVSAPPVAPPVISSFTASPPAIAYGQSSVLFWNVSGAASLSLNQGIGAVAGASKSVSPAETTAYTLTAANSMGSTAATVTVIVSQGVPANPDLDQYGGYVKVKCVQATGRFHVEKLNQRWVLCTPAGNALWSMGISYVNWENDQVVQSKYATGYTANPTLNWALQAMRRMQTWGFNTNPSGMLWTMPWIDHNDWPTPDKTIPIRAPFICGISATIYSSYNANNYAPGPTKNYKQSYKKSVYGGWMAGAADNFDPNFDAWIAGEVRNNPLFNACAKGLHNDYLLALESDEADNTGGMRAGDDFTVVNNGHLGGVGTDAHWAWLTLTTSPHVAAASYADTPKQRATTDLVFADTKFYNKWEMASWLQQTGDSGPGYSSIAQLNAAWGSSYGSFGSDASSWSQTVGTGDGTTATFSFNLANKPLTPLTVQVKVGGVPVAGDDGAGPRASPKSDTGNLRGNASRNNILGTINYASGAGAITFVSPPASGARGGVP